MTTTCRTLQFRQIAMWTRNSTPELSQQSSLEIRRNRVLEPLSLIMHLVPFHPKNLGEHAFNQVVANRQFAGNLPSSSRQPHASVRIHPHQSIFLQPAHRHGYSRRRDFEPVRERSGDDSFPFTLGFENRLQVVFFRDCNHVCLLYGEDYTAGVKHS